MGKYDYREAVHNDVKNALENDYEIDRSMYQYPDAKYDLMEKLCDEFWTWDSITGNGSGSYTFNSYKAEENLCHNMDLLGEALEEFGCSLQDIFDKGGAEACDVTIRCYLLNITIYDIVEEMDKQGFFEMEGEE